ncbi:MAG: hypothetical protein QNJ55_25755 [Xenococcus sp. MO_188.B8]|nr:hypothetical protein [Xenococcus sp. MO_188.B8]
MWLVWRCLVVAVPGCCVRRLVRSLARLSGAVLLPVVVLLPLPSLSLVWSVLWFGFVLAFALSLALSGLSRCPSCADLLLLGVRPLFSLRKRSPVEIRAIAKVIILHVLTESKSSYQLRFLLSSIA